MVFAKRIVRSLVPEAWLAPLIDRYFRVRWTGDYSSWEEAAEASRGYGDEAILARVSRAARLARDGVVAFERDGMTFAEAEPNGRLLDVLRAAAAEKGGRLRVLDFGGALGSAYWQNRAWLGGMASLRWCVVEQTHFVEAGRREFANEQLGFFSSIAEAGEGEGFDVVLLAGVLGYLREPHAWLETFAALGARHVFIERTGFVQNRETDRLTVQHVPRNLYRASYPCWFFREEAVLAHFQPDYALHGAHTEGFRIAPGVVYRVLYLKRST